MYISALYGILFKMNQMERLQLLCLLLKEVLLLLSRHYRPQVGEVQKLVVLQHHQRLNWL